MIEINDVLNLIGRELKDNSEQSKRFREFIENDKWTTEHINKWLAECISKGSGPHDPYNRAFQDLIVSIGKKIGFEISYGRYAGKTGEDNYDGIWKRINGDVLVLEAKTSTWPIGSVSQLGEYIDNLSKKGGNENYFGLYVIGKGEIQPLIEQIIGSKYKDRMRLIIFEDMIELLRLREKLEPVIGKDESINKIHNILMPIESINLGNIIRLIIDVATITEERPIGPEEPPEAEIEPKDEIWIKGELVPYVEEARPYQRLLLAALVQIDKEPAPMKKVIFLMNEIVKRKPSEGINKKITGRELAGARAGLKMRRKPLKKEDIIDSSWDASEHDYIYKIKDDYKETIIEWVKKQGLWIKEELE